MNNISSSGTGGGPVNQSAKNCFPVNEMTASGPSGEANQQIQNKSNSAITHALHVTIPCPLTLENAQQAINEATSKAVNELFNGCATNKETCAVCAKKGKEKLIEDTSLPTPFSPKQAINIQEMNTATPPTKDKNVVATTLTYTGNIQAITAEDVDLV